MGESNYKLHINQQKKASWGTRTRTYVTAGRVEHADHPAVQPNTFTVVNRLTALLIISRQAVRSCLGSFFAKRVHISRAPEIRRIWEIGRKRCVSAPMFFGIFCLEFHSLFRAPGNANKIFILYIDEQRTAAEGMVARVASRPF